jgi:isopropylmalate/homocitrate/citramalate synthase
MDRIFIVDGTLREGEQSPGVHFTTDEKLQIAQELDRIGVPLLDVGMPSVSPDEREAIRAIAQAGLSASIGVSCRLNRNEVDQSVACGADEIFLICSVSPLHLRYKLGMDEEGVRRLAEDVVRYSVRRGLAVNFVAEDACRAEPSFLCGIIKDAHQWGARRAYICDTVGVAEPFQIRSLIEEVRSAIPPEMALGCHCHNDLGLATANTLAAVEAGVTHPSVTVNGIGERAGNAPLHEVVMTIEKKLNIKHGIAMQGLYGVSKLVERCSGILIPPHAPLVGLNAFRHESGIHVDGILKNSQTYTGVDPQGLGREPTFILGKHTGTQFIRHLLQQRGYQTDEGQLQDILSKVKEWKTRDGKAEIERMVREVEEYYERCLGFPQDAFWQIVEGVMHPGE